MLRQSAAESRPKVEMTKGLGIVTKKERKAEGNRNPADCESAMRWSDGEFARVIWDVTRPMIISGRVKW